MKKFIKDLIFLILYYSSAILIKKSNALPPKIHKVLIISWHLIGDTFLSLSTIASLKKHLPNSSITVVCKPLAKDLLYNFKEINNVITINDNYLNFKELNRLRNNYDITIDLTNNLPSAFFSLYSDSKYKIGGSGIYKALGKKYVGFPLIYDKTISPPGNDYVIEYLQKIVLNVFPEMKIDENWQFETSDIKLKTGVKAQNHIFIGFGLGASRNENLWETEKWIILSNKLTENKNCLVLLLGSSSEKQLADKIISKTNSQVVSSVGKDPLLVTISKISRLDYFIGNDSGLMHIAVHYKVPTVCLSGPSNYFNYIPKNNNKIKSIHKDIFCQPCYNFLHISEQLTHFECTHNVSLCKKLITVNDVLSNLEELQSAISKNK